MSPQPEQQARREIDRLLTAAGWSVQDADRASIHAARGVAIREFPLPGHGFADYLLYVDGQAAGVIEAKKAGATLSGVEVQAERYTQGLPADLPRWDNPLPFAYQSTGAGELSFRIYDPNYPGRDDVTIRATERTEGEIDDPTRPGNTIPILGIECRQWLGHKDLRPIRGLFVMPYTPTPPPPNLSSIPRTNNSTPAPSR